MTGSQRPRRLLGFRKSLAPATSAMIAGLIWSGLASPVGGEEKIAVPSQDRGVLSEIAQDVLRRGSTGPNQSVPEATSPGPHAEKSFAVGGRAPDPLPPITHIAPARDAISVPIPPAFSAPKKKIVPESPTTSYRSNSGRQARPETARALSFSSGVLAPSSGLDPALKAHADGLRAQGRQFVYGFLRLRVRPDEALEKSLAGLGVQLLGPHDDHHKVRLPIGSLQAVAALPDVEWIGVSAPEQKLSPELTGLRRRPEQGGGCRRRGRAPDRHQSLRGRREWQLPAATGSRWGRARRVRPRAPLLSRRGHLAGHREDHRPRLRALRRADPADVCRA